MKKVVVGLGEILWDVFPERKILGGAPANFAYHISQFGFEGYAVSAIGNDNLGKEILESLGQKNLKHLLQNTPFPTGTVQVTLSGAGIPSYEICENVAWDNIPFSEEMKKLAEKTDVVCFGSLAQRNEVSQKTIHQFLDAMSSDSLKIFDINLRLHFYNREIIEKSLQKANIFKINDEELIKIAQMFDIKGDEKVICEYFLKEFKLKVLILTKGTDGSLILTPSEVSSLPTPKVQVADTVGAGDSFTAAFTAAYLHGKSLAQAHQLAVEVSAYVCQQHGAMPKLADTYLQMLNEK